MQYLTDFADQAVMLPLAAAAAFGFAMFGWWRGLLAWLVVVPGVLGTVGVLKFVFFSCAGPLAATGIHSPSGHTAAAAVIYGGLCVLLLRGRVPDGVLFAVPPAFAVLFGVSRLAVHAHVPAEVLMGGGIGLAGAAVLVPLAGRRPDLRTWPFVLAAALVALAFHGLRAQAERLTHDAWLFAWVPLPVACHG